MKKMNQILCLAVVLLISAASFGQGVTTASINGQITDANNEPLPGANVVAVHTPSGSTYGVAADFDGYYRMSNMRVGGPYKLTITYVGYQEFLKQDIYLQLGDSQQISVKLTEDASALDEVVITAQTNSLFDSGKTGAETTISNQQVTSLPTLSRGIADFVRLTPQAKVTGDDVISIAGQNNRYNAIYIDGAVNNDVFGLAPNGTNGGQTGVSPISLDAIESFQINVAPFDVRQSGFAGGSINAITKSGTNTFEGSAYSFYRDQSLAGKTPFDLAGEDGEREKLDDFTALTYGVRLGGPIIEDKLFFFINYERQDNETPQPFDIENYRGDVTAADLNNLSDFLQSNYGYNAGGYANNTSSLESDKLIAKIDWNINQNHKLSLKHSYVKAIQLDAPSSNSGRINFLNRAVNFESTTNSTALELSSTFGNKFANNLVIGYTSVDDNRDPNGSPFPSVEIRDAAGTSIFFGSEPFSTANLLEQRVLTFTNNFEIYSGKHTITIGTNNEFSSAKNVFFRQNFGDYRFNNLQDFLGGAKPNRYRYGYSLLGGTGDNSQGAAEFDLFQLGLYVQDEVSFSDSFKLTAGVRVDIPYWEDGLVNDDFNNRTIPLLEANGKDLQEARVGQGINANVHISPRVGFNWDVNNRNMTQVRGGVGIFTSRLPLVWPGGAYNNNGLTAGFIQLTGGNTPDFNPNPNTQFADPEPGSGAIGGQVDLFAKDFKLPQVFKTNIAVDQKLGAGFVLSAEFIWNDNINAVVYENINLQGPQFNTTGAGSRPNYGFRLIDDTYSDIYLGSNTGAGSSYNANMTLSNNYITDRLDIRSAVTYTYGDADVLLDATSSQNSSQWRNLETVNGSNRPVLSTSDFSPGHRVLANSSFEFKWSETIKTRIGLFYDGAEGSPFSYVYNGNNLLSDTGSDSALIYVPRDESEAQLVDTDDLTASQQYALLNAFIEGDDYLSSRRGQFAERNADRSDWIHIVDLKFAQEFGVKFGEKIHSLELTADIFNFTNLLNKEWGVRTFAGFNQVQLLDFERFAADGTTPLFSYDPRAADTVNIVDDSGLSSSRWQMQVGLRYSF
ncbi:TonB-dependent receptor [Subsaximicrobium wynnwilliamsii]|uniref:TonB-dependent receptor n=2 Tax=Subsaximicrobium wynnwilliamsii TaxID=291179 RepID=A0A5C6ZJW9_9FLAO|nr:carboxypeptidase regulatory-like domain-containing protein [Subsaximicrobium wynnwilliamsii]TXD83678.1 TonB-dependent receptor [Subsaximicrobium wynnwilliamsii]TXD89438.1 TonB-dependent receptor [Subsaximicrobium wynnwilliamsii]TXE03515.1 TonB-dependent receptor [Subsaximicrobium wynnwilliamsii]